MNRWFSQYKLKDREEDVWQSLWRGAVSEFIATMLFVFIGTGSVIATKATLGESSIQISSLTVISLAHGFAIMVLIYAVGEVSGGHINPAVTWACLITHRVSLLRAVTYVISQLVGAIIGSALLKSIIPPDFQFSMGCSTINPLLTAAQGFGAEVIFTFIFIFVVFATAISPFAGKFSPLSSGGGREYGPGKLTPFAVGMTILVLCLVGIPLTGASMNPARSFGPAVVRGIWANHWVYWIGPLLGSTIAAFVAQSIFLSDPGVMLKVFNVSRGDEGGKEVIPMEEKLVQKNQENIQVQLE
jgi:MIP family channel proteins